MFLFFIASQGKHEAAGRAFERCLVIRENALGPHHILTAEVLAEHAFLLLKQVNTYRQRSEIVLWCPPGVVLCAVYVSGAESVGKKVFPKCSNRLLHGRNVIPGLRDKYAEAYPLHLRATEVAEQVSVPGRLGLAARLIGPFLSECAVIFQEKRDELYPLLVRTTEIIRKSVGPYDPQVGALLKFHADVLCGQVRAARIVHEVVIGASNGG